MRRPLLATTIWLVVVITAAGASGQIGDEVEEAADRLDAVTAALGAAELQRAVTLDDLVAAIGEWQAVVDQQTSSAFEVAELRSSISDGELRASQLKDQVRQRAVDAYMAGGVGMLDTLLVADSLADIATAEIVLDSLGRRASEDLEVLAAHQDELGELRSVLASQEVALAERNERVSVMIDELDILFADAGSEVAALHTARLAADAEYRQAYELLEEMRALQRANGAGVDRWRPIVEHYFPSDRVDQAMEVMWCESRGNPKATHPTSDAAGLFQFMAGTWDFVSPRAGFGGASRYDPEANIASAAWLVEFSIDTDHRFGAWGRWSCQPLTEVP